MPINPKGGIVTGDKARQKITRDIIAQTDLSSSELEFILRKLKDSNYKGFEFETFYSVWVKLNEKLNQSKKG